ncbi:unnamed protein product [Mytilus edulis]|uniref:Reverse transcriptase domain-containing protein n=1 Tax=Mytilus edulis TaxID=6550 RepID=A0A8S3THV3_MYTED|nr:unnamed protein product [Mytilus edulis]
MYDDTTCRIKFQNGLSEEFISNRGVKQGDVLSPLLFNLYINNLVKSLQDANTDPIVIGDTTINSLLFADDIVLLSNSEKGLQTALNVLSDFCKCWKLEVNINKSKVIIFNSNGKTHNNFFKYNNEFLETVKSYCYLGMTLQHTGNLNLCSSLLVEKEKHKYNVMSSIKERQFFLQLLSFVTGPAIDVMQHYFEVKILTNIEFEDFLNDPNNIHQLFHQCYPTTPCCKCMTASLASSRKRGCLHLQQFDKLYDNSGLPQPKHENMMGSTILQHCLCKFSAKGSVTVDELDITLFYDVVQHCCPSKMNFMWRKNIKDVRNFLSHIPNGQVNNTDFEDNWRTLTNATLGFAREIGIKCKKMFEEKISEIKNSSIEVLKEKLKKSNEDTIKMLETLNGIKQTTVDECKKTVELINYKQDENFKELFGNNIYGILVMYYKYHKIITDKSDEISKETKENTTEMRKLNHKVDNLESVIRIAIEKALEKTKGQSFADDNREITIATKVDSSSWDEENTITKLSNIVKSESDEKSGDAETFQIKNVEHKCIQLDLVASPDVFKTKQNLRKAVKSLVHQLVEAGEINTKISGKLAINLTVKSPLTRDEIDVVHAVFDKSETFEEEYTGEGIDLKPVIHKGFPLVQALKTDPDHFEKSGLKSEVENIDDCTMIKKVKMEITDDAKYEEIFIAVDNLKCLLKLTGLPNDLLHTAPGEKSSDVKGNQLLYVEWTMECPLKWNVALISSSINDNLCSFHDEFSVDYVYSETSSKLIIHTTVQRCVFRSYSTLEVAVKNLIGKIINVASIKSTEPEELSASVLIMTKPEDEESFQAKSNKDWKTDKSISGLKDNIFVHINGLKLICRAHQLVHETLLL